MVVSPRCAQVGASPLSRCSGYHTCEPLLQGNARLADDLLELGDVGAKFGAELLRLRGHRLISHRLEAHLRIRERNSRRGFALNAFNNLVRRTGGHEITLP